MILITDAGGNELARLQPDEQGNFDYRVERRMTYRVVADSLDGHQAVWTLQADEFSPSLPAAEEAERRDAAAGTQTRPPPATAEGAGVSTRSLTEAELERTVARQIRPLREALRDHDEQVRLRDILGGIGYIVGLAGLGLWWSRRRKESR